jgi:hypothetical protein
LGKVRSSLFQIIKILHQNCLGVPTLDYLSFSLFRSSEICSCDPLSDNNWENKNHSITIITIECSFLCYQDQIIQKAKKIFKRFSPCKPQTPNQKRNYCKFIFLTNKQCQFNKLSRKLKTFARSGCIPCRPKILMTSFSKSLFLLLSEQIVSKLLCDKKIT